MNHQQAIIHIPKNISKYKGQYILFYSEDKNPDVIFNTFFAEEAYKRAKDIGQKFKKIPVVYRVNNEQNLITHFVSSVK